MTPPRFDAYIWQSDALLAAELAPEGSVRKANAALERLAGRPLTGEPFASMLSPPQRAAFCARLAAAEDEWARSTFSFSLDPVRPAEGRTVWLRRARGAVLVVAEPAVSERERLVETVLALNDDLIAAQRELVRERERLRCAHVRLGHLEAIASAGLAHPRADDMLEEVLRVIAAALGADRAAVLLLDPDGTQLEVRAAIGTPDRAPGPTRVAVGNGVAGAVTATREAQVVTDASETRGAGGELHPAARSLAAVPMVVGREVIGVLQVSADAPRRFGDDALGLLVPAAARAALALSRALVHERDRSIAETLQRALLPERLPDVDGLAIAARFTPGAQVEVGGDWYDAMVMPGGELAVVIGDVAGKGLRAASLMGELRSALRAYLLDGGPPQQVLGRLDRLARRSGHMATAVLAFVEPSTGAVRFASAGHLPPLLVRSGGEVSLLRGGASAPLMVFDDDLAPATATLSRGDRLVLYTDGLVERRREPIDESLERLVGAAREVGRRPALEETADALIDALRPPPGTAADDTALIAVERR